jgi:hypothetical protein
MRLTRPLVAVAALAIAGCGKGTQNASLYCSPPECPYRTQLALVAEVQPPSSGPYVNQEFASLSLDSMTGHFTLQLDEPVTLSGTVKVTMAGQERAVQAAIVATRASRIAGRPQVYYQTASDPKTGAYQLLVSPNVAGEQYTVRVAPSDPTQLPPIEQQLTATTNQSFDFAYPDPATLPELRGAVSDSLQAGVTGMQVRATDPMSGSVVSTTVMTDVDGSFSLRLMTSAPSTVLLTAAPVATPAGQPVLWEPTLSRSATLVNGPMIGSLTQADLQLPPLPAPTHLIYVVSSPGLSGASTPVVGATCVFSADVSDPNSLTGVTAAYTAGAVTDAQGNASVTLIPALSGNRTYNVTITPDPSSSFQATTTTLQVAPNPPGVTQIMGLAIRPQLYGQVFDPTGRPLVDATVAPMLGTLGVAPSNGNAPGQPHAPVPTASPPTMVGNDGYFALRVDPSVWDVGIIPPPTMMLPRLWKSGTIVVADTSLGIIPIPRGVMVQGRVRDAGNHPVANADVLIYTVPTSNAKCAGQTSGCLTPPHLHAEGPTDNSGAITVVLSSKPID